MHVHMHIRMCMCRDFDDVGFWEKDQSLFITKSCLEVWPPAKRAPLTHWIEEEVKSTDPGNGTAVGLVPFEQRGEPLIVDSGGVSQTTSEGHDKGSEGIVPDSLNSLFVGPFLDILMFSVAGGKRLSVHGG